MRKIICALISCSLFLGGAAMAEPNTSKAKVTKAKKCLFPKSRKRAPDWVCSGQDAKLEISAVGSFAKSKAGIAFMEEMASADARKKLAAKISKETLEGTKILRSAYAPNGTIYVLVGMDEAATK
jgi:hypothetical protein